jgi:hypothetical protein
MYSSKKELFFILLILLTFQAFSQSTKVVIYSFVKESHIIGRLDSITCYWKIDTSKQIVLSNKIFYAFEFSTDSIFTRDFIHIDMKTREYSFISSHLAKNGIEESDIQTFNLSKKGKYIINNFGIMGSVNRFKIKKRGDLTLLENIYIEDIVPGNSFYVNELIFSTELFPIIIVFSIGGNTKYTAHADW